MISIKPIVPCEMSFNAVLSNNLTQSKQPGDQAPWLLQLPKEILVKIGACVATDKDHSDIQAAENAVNFGKICVSMHIATHHEAIAQVINNGLAVRIKEANRRIEQEANRRIEQEVNLRMEQEAERWMEEEANRWM